MYQVYSTQRPGRPGWALVVSGALLLATVGMAGGVVHVKHSANKVTLGEVELYESARIRFRAPLNWQREPGGSEPAVLEFIEPDSRREKGRRLIVFREPCDPLSSTTEDGVAILSRVAHRASRGLAPSEGLGVGWVGRYPGQTLVLRSLFQLPGSPTSALGRVAVAPSGDILGAVLLLSAEPRSGDLKLLDQVCEPLALGDSPIVEDPEAVMTASGVSFEPPAGVRFVDTRALKPPHLRMTDGGADSSWFLAVYPMRIESADTLDQLISNTLESKVLRTDRLREGEEFQVGERKVLRIPLASPVPDEVVSFVAAVRVDARSALLMVGRSDAAGQEQLDLVFRAVAARAKVSSGEEPQSARRSRKR